MALCGRLVGTDADDVRKYNDVISKFTKRELWHVKQAIVYAAYSTDITSEEYGKLYDIGSMEMPRYVGIVRPIKGRRDVVFGWARPRVGVWEQSEKMQWYFNVDTHMEQRDTNVGDALNREGAQLAAQAIAKLFDEPDYWVSYHAKRASTAFYTLVSLPTYVRSCMGGVENLDVLGLPRQQNNSMEDMFQAKYLSNLEYRLALLKTWRPFVRRIQYSRVKSRLVDRSLTLDRWYKTSYMFDERTVAFQSIQQMSAADADAVFRTTESVHREQLRAQPDPEISRKRKIDAEVQTDDIGDKRSCTNNGELARAIDDMQIGVDRPNNNDNEPGSSVDTRRTSSEDRESIEPSEENMDGDVAANVQGCTICFEDHEPTACEIADLMAPAALWNLIGRKELCAKCWKVQDGHACKYANRKCTHCEQQHNPAICPRPRYPLDHKPIGITFDLFGENREKVHEWRVRHLWVYQMAAKALIVHDDCTAPSPNELTEEQRQNQVALYLSRSNKAMPPLPHTTWPEYWKFVERFKIPVMRMPSQNARKRSANQRQQRHSDNSSQT